MSARPGYHKRKIRLESGERFPLLINASTGLPCPWACRYSLAHHRTKSINTGGGDIDSLCLLYDWAARNGIDLDQRIGSGNLFSMHEIEMLSDALRISRKAPREQNGKKVPRVVGANTHGNYLRDVIAFVKWRVAHVTTALPVGDTRIPAIKERLDQNIRQMKSLISSEPQKKRVGLTEEQQAFFIKVIHPDHDLNPFARANRHRNYAVLLLLFEVGPRRADAVDAMRCYVAHLIKTKNTGTVRGAFYSLKKLSHAQAFRAAADANTVVPYLALSETRELLGSADYMLHHCRAFYRWAVAQGFASYSQDVLDEAEDLVIGGNAKGHAVRSEDPRKGPLTKQEVDSLVLALKAARLQDTIPLDEQAAIVLALATGSNAGQYASMREEDLQPLVHDGQTTGWILQVPRHKKGGGYYRDEFRKRKLGRLFGRVVQDLVDQNRANPRPGPACDVAISKPRSWPRCR